MTQPTAPHPSGYWTLLTSGLTVVIALVGALLIQPRLSERRLNIDDQYILTATEVRSLPAGTLSVVLDRSPGEDHNDFNYRLLKLVLKRSGRPFALGLSEVVVAQDEAVAALENGVATSSRNPVALSVGVYGAGVDVNRRLRPVPIPVTGGILGLRSGWTHRSHMARLATIRTRQDLGDIVLLQGLGWSDVGIFDAAGLRTFTARSARSVPSGGSPTGAVVPQGHCGVGARGAADGVIDIKHRPGSTSAACLSLRRLLLRQP